MTDGTMRGAAALALALVLAGCGGESEAAPSREAPVVTIGPEAVEVVALGEITTGPGLSGTLAAEREATVSAQQAGTLVAVYADKGQPVRQGQILARIDDSAIRDQVTSTQSGVRRHSSPTHGPARRRPASSSATRKCAVPSPAW